MFLINKIKEKIYRPKQEKRHSPGNKTKRVLIGEPGIPKVEIQIELEPSSNRKSQGCEAWFLDIRDSLGEPISDWKKSFINARIEPKQLGDTKVPLLVQGEDIAVILELPKNAQICFFTHPWSGRVRIACGNRQTTFELYSPVGSNKLISVDDLLTKFPLDQEIYSKTDQKWLIDITNHSPECISIINPNWRGVKSATENLIQHYYLQKDNLNEISAQKKAQLIKATGCKKLVIGGFPISFELLVRELKKQQPDIKICALWFSSFVQFNEKYVNNSFSKLIQLCKEGIIDKIGFAKKGMAEIITQNGVNALFVASYFRTIPQSASQADTGGPHLGIWSLSPTWRKTPYAMIAACGMIPNAMVHMVDHEKEAVELGNYLNVKFSLRESPVDQHLMSEALAKMHVNLYVTMSECSPMLPLESLAVGVPCLFGPNSHLFEDNDYLHSRLVVPYPDRSDIIANMIEQALREREQIILAYREYAHTYNEYAKSTISKIFDDL